jgi:hypothetical protein
MSGHGEKIRKAKGNEKWIGRLKMGNPPELNAAQRPVQNFEPALGRGVGYPTLLNPTWKSKAGALAFNVAIKVSAGYPPGRFSFRVNFPPNCIGNVASIQENSPWVSGCPIDVLWWGHDKSN